MALRVSHRRIVRVVEGVRGTVPMSVWLNPRFDYGKTAPWINVKDQAVSAGAGPEAVIAGRRADHITDRSARSRVLGVRGRARLLGSHVALLLGRRAAADDAVDAVAETDAWWRAWSGRSTYKGAWKDEVERSLITLKALTHASTGGLVAAATTSLPSSSAA